MTGRIPISEVDCRIVDLLLIHTFDWQDLHNILRGHGEEVPASSCVPLQDLVVKRVHDLCHRDTEVARTVTARLDRFHRDDIAAIADQDVESIAKRWIFDEIDAPRAGEIWAMFSDPRTELRRLLPTFLLRMQYAWLRAFVAPVTTPLQETRRS